MSDSQETFLFDEFFEPEEKRTVVIPVTIRGRKVPFTVKTTIPVEDRMAAEAASLKRVVGEDGEVKLEQDASESAYELLARLIVDWPFKFKDGSKVPVNAATVRKLLGGTADLMAVVAKIDAGEVDKLVPFDSASDAH